MFSLWAKQRLVPSVFCIRLINFSFLYPGPEISAGFFVISHTPGYSNPRKAQLHLRVFALGSFQQSPLLYPFLQLYHVRRVDAEEDIQDFCQFRSGLDSLQVIMLFLRTERSLHRCRPHSGKFLPDKVFLLLLLWEWTVSFHERRPSYDLRLLLTIPKFSAISRRGRSLFILPSSLFSNVDL